MAHNSKTGNDPNVTYNTSLTKKKKKHKMLNAKKYAVLGWRIELLMLYIINFYGHVLRRKLVVVFLHENSIQ